METNNAKRLVMALRKMSAAWPRADFPEATILVYAEALADLPVERVESAVSHLVRNSEWLPTIAKIRAEAEVVHRVFAETEWALVLGEVKRVGVGYKIGFVLNGKRYERRGPTFASAITEEVVRVIGWRDICETEDPIKMRDTFLRTWSKVAENYRSGHNDNAIDAGGGHRGMREA